MAGVHAVGAEHGDGHRGHRRTLSTAYHPDVDEVDEARERRTGWLAYSALLVDVALLVAADVVPARGFAARGTDDSVTLIGDPRRRNPVVTRVCALPLLLLGPALIVGLAVSELPFPKRGSGPPLSFAVVIVGLVAAIGPLLWAYYGSPGWGLTATGLWLAYAGLLVAGWPVAAVVVGLPVAVAQFIVNARMSRRLLGLR
jgi:hypothetical protein